MSLETEYGLNYNDYIVLARFYPKTNKNELFDKLQNVSETRRLFADVILKGSESDAIGAYIIMINPGSCKPTGEVYKEPLGICDNEADLSYRYIKPWKVSSQIEIINALSDQWKERMDAKSFGH